MGVAVNIVRGQKVPLSQLTSDGQVSVTVSVTGVVVDVACFGLDADARLSDDRYMVFFNQPSSPSSEVRMSQNGSETSFAVNARALPDTIHRLCFTAASEDRPLSTLGPSALTVVGAASTATFSFNGGDFTNEKAVILADIYRKDGVWRLGAVGQGFNDGLSALVRHFGGDVAGDQPQAPTSAPAPAPLTAAGAVDLVKREGQVSLEKQMAASAPALLSLAKRAAVSLERHGLGTHTAKVALVLDISASMSALYRSGKVQAIAERILALGTRFDDDGEVDLFLFGTDAHEAGGMRIDNHSGFVDRLVQRRKLEGGTRYGKAMKLVRQFYCDAGGPRTTPHSMAMPVYVMFVTDGATQDKAETERQLISSSFEPIFWQFLGLGMSSRGPGTKRRGLLGSLSGGGEFEFLERLDDLPGRHVDNADFFAVMDPSSISDDEVFELLMVEYPQWLVEARAKGLLH